MFHSVHVRMPEDKYAFNENNPIVLMTSLYVMDSYSSVLYVHCPFVLLFISKYELIVSIIIFIIE